jgi:Protein NO VEIN, C-terminal/Domain of unknown function (DUF3427)
LLAARVKKEQMATLTLYEDYTRKDVHDVFDPDSAFTRSSGTWGISGIIRIPSRPGDFVLFVTFGQSVGAHVFDEGITLSGVLSWQSQPRQGLQDRTVQEFIAHDEALNSIYLFLRTAKERPYTFLGRLKYLVHDATREHPVYFQWQILDWDQTRVPSNRMNLRLTPEIGHTGPVERSLTGLVETDPPRPTNRKGVSTHTFQTCRVPDRSAIERQNRVLGKGGEKLVVTYEKEYLRKFGRADLADRIVHVSEVQGDGAGFDIHSFTLEGEPKFIEVKTTAGPAETPFYLSSNEVAFAKVKRGQFYLYRLYDYSEGRSAFYVISGDPKDSFQLTPVQFRAVR